MKNFQMVCGLWVTPDFDEAQAGRADPPRVDHTRVDFEALRKAIAHLFHYGPPVKIQIPNDTIDQVSVHFRNIGVVEASVRCDDFGAELLRCAKSSKANVIDVRSAWLPLHTLSDRTYAPPPVILPFVVTATDFEDAMIWHSSTRPSMGLPVFDPITAALSGNSDQDWGGKLPASFLATLHQIFGTPFKSTTVLDRMVTDPIPLEYGL